MRYSINLQGVEDPATIRAQVGRVEFNGVAIFPYEAAMLADALRDCAAAAEDQAAEAVLMGASLARTS